MEVLFNEECSLFFDVVWAAEFRKSKNFLRNIFSFQFVSEYNISIVKDSIIFDLYVSNVFYRFIFRLKKDDSKFYVLKKEMDRIKIFIIWVKNYGQSFEKYSFDVLSNVFLDGDNGEVDSLFSNFSW